VGFYLGGVEHLTNLVTLRSGRFPTICKPARCEVLQIGVKAGLAPRQNSFGTINLKLIEAGGLKKYIDSVLAFQK
jgi:hypothetical protein